MLPLPLLVTWQSPFGSMSAGIILWAVVGRNGKKQPEQDPNELEFFTEEGRRVLTLMTVMHIHPSHTPLQSACGQHFSSPNALANTLGVHGALGTCSTRLGESRTGRLEKITMREIITSTVGFHNHHLLQQRVSVDPTEMQAPKICYPLDMLALLCDHECNIVDCASTGQALSSWCEEGRHRNHNSGRGRGLC